MGFRSQTHIPSFEFGEIDPRAINANQLDQYRNGAAKARNFTINVQRNLEVRAAGVDIETEVAATFIDGAAGVSTATGTTAQSSVSGQGDSGTFARFEGDFPNTEIGGMAILGLSQTPVIMAPEWYWTFGVNTPPGGAAPSHPKVMLRGTGTLHRDDSTNSSRMKVISLGTSLRRSDLPWDTTTYMNDYGIRVGNVRAKWGGLYIGGDDVPRMSFNHIGLETAHSRQSRLGRDGWFRNETPVLGEAWLRTLNDLTLYIYSRHDHRTYRLPFREAQLDNERQSGQSSARDEDEIVFKWDIAKVDVPFKYAYDLPELSQAVDHTYNWCLGERGMEDEEVFPYPAERFDMKVNTDDETLVSLEKLPIQTPVDVYMVFPEPARNKATLTTDNVPGSADYDDRIETNYRKVEAFRVRPFAGDPREQKFSFMRFKSIDDGTVLGLCSSKGIQFYDQEEGTRLPGWVPFDATDDEGNPKDIDPRLLRFAADTNAVVVVHPDFDPFIMRRLAKGVFGKARLELDGIDQEDEKFRPAAVAFLNERLFFAGTAALPTGIWGSRAGNVRDFRFETADPTVATSPFRFEIKHGLARIHDIVTQNYMGFLTTEALWFRDSNTPISPQDFALRKATDRGGDPRSSVADIRGRVAYQNDGLGEAILATYVDDNKGFEAQPMSLPNAHLFKNGGVDRYAIGQWYDESGELFYLFTAVGDGRLVVTTILPGQFFGSTPWDFHRKYELVGRKLQTRTVELDRPVLGFWAGEGEVWVVLAEGTGVKLQRVVTSELGSVENDDVEAEFESLPEVLTNQEGQGTPGGSFLHKRRIIVASLDIDGPFTDDSLGYILVGTEWRPVSEAGIVRFGGLPGYSERASFKYYTQSPLRMRGLATDSVWVGRGNG